MKKLKSLRVLPWSLSLQVTELGLGPDAQTVLFPIPTPRQLVLFPSVPLRKMLLRGGLGGHSLVSKRMFVFWEEWRGEEIGRVLGYLKTKVPQQQVACGKRYQKPND